MTTYSPSLAWDIVEGAIERECEWLASRIHAFQNRQHDGVDVPLVCCNHCLFRKIAMLIVTGKITAKEYRRDPSLLSFWGDYGLDQAKSIYHGKEWHSRTMEHIASHFSKQGFRVELEPSFHWGRVDLGIYAEDVQPLLIEVGTISIFKLWINLKKMRGVTYLLVPSDDVLVEFRTN